MLGDLGPRTETRPFPWAAPVSVALPMAARGRFRTYSHTMNAQCWLCLNKESEWQPKGAVKLSVFPQG